MRLAVIAQNVEASLLHLVVALWLCFAQTIAQTFSNLNALAGEAFNLMWCPPFTATLLSSASAALCIFSRPVCLLHVKILSN
jgi:hypothetical protein